MNKKNRINQQLNQQIKVKLIPYENEFYKHVMKNCFWVIEEESENKNKIEKIPSNFYFWFFYIFIFIFMYLIRR